MILSSLFAASSFCNRVWPRRQWNPLADAGQFLHAIFKGNSFFSPVWRPLPSKTLAAPNPWRWRFVWEKERSVEAPARAGFREGRGTVGMGRKKEKKDGQKVVRMWDDQSLKPDDKNPSQLQAALTTGLPPHNVIPKMIVLKGGGCHVSPGLKKRITVRRPHCGQKIQNMPLSGVAPANQTKERAKTKSSWISSIFVNSGVFP